MGCESENVRCFWFVAPTKQSSDARDQGLLTTWTPTEPATGTTLGQVGDCELDDFRIAIRTASTAQAKYYEETTASERGAFLRRWSESILENANDCESFSFARLQRRMEDGTGADQ
jgi:acyl-CoA reductase-like NAD-dependent aldehyde dehydrogenase